MTPPLLMLAAASLPCVLAATVQAGERAPPPTQWPLLLPKWQPEWTLNRSTISQPCNYSGWFSPQLGAQFGIISFDWANNENSWRQRPLSPGPNSSCLQPRGWAPHCYYPVQEDLIEQAQKIKAVDNRTRVFVYRQGQGSPGAEGGKQGEQLSEDPRYSGFFLNAKGTNRSTGVFDFRNASVIDWFVDTLVGGPTCLGHPAIDGLFLDDVDGLGSPGSPDATPIVKETGLAPSDVAAWNKGQRAAVIRAQKLAVERGKFNWQLLKPGIAGMLQPAPDAASCIDGTNATTVGAVPFPGLRRLCSKDGVQLSRGIPLFMALWHDRGEADRWYGQGSCTETADCTRDQCQHDGGEIPCGPIANIRERIATFQLIRGDYAWMGYSWAGCAGTDHRRPWQITPDSGKPCFFNASLNCSGYVDGSHWLAPKDWEPEQGTMSFDFGGDQRPLDEACKETSPGVFERRFKKRTVRLDCNTFTASFPVTQRSDSSTGDTLDDVVARGGYGGRGTLLP